MIYRSEENRKDYFPAILGNGQVAFAPDCEGVLTGAAAFDGDAQSPFIWWEGRRTAKRAADRVAYTLYPFGALAFSAGAGELVRFDDDLLVREGRRESTCTYADGLTVESRFFLCREENLYCLEKRPVNGDAVLEFTYAIRESAPGSLRGFAMEEAASDARGVTFRYSADGYHLYRGCIRAFVDRDADVTAEGDACTLRVRVPAGERVTFYLALCDDFMGSDPEAELVRLTEKTASMGFAGLLEENTARWQAFFSHSRVELSETVWNEIYDAALYNIACYATPWSIPVSINDMGWHGKYFAFDEFFPYMGLMAADRLDIARRTPAFRLAGLEQAVRRAAYAPEQPEMWQARYPWETTETGEESSPPGSWHDHIFHMAHVAIGAWEYYRYSGDRDFLAECYPMIRACCNMFVTHMVQEADGRCIVGRCTDLERLGVSIENAYMTTCAVIASLHAFVGAAEVLDREADVRARWAALANRLQADLPVEEGRFVPHHGCEQKSVAVFAGSYPYPVADYTDPRLQAAWDDYEANEAGYGNMYRVGVRISPWYALWKAAAFARAGMGERAYAALQQLLPSVGPYGSLYEINEPSYRCRPWFTTAAGVYLSAIHAMLLQGDEKGIHIFPGMPEAIGSASFHLAIPGAILVEAEVRDGVLLAVSAKRRDTDETVALPVSFRGVPWGMTEGMPV